MVERWKAEVYLDLSEQRNPGTDEFANGFNGGIIAARDLIYAKIPTLFTALSSERDLLREAVIYAAETTDDKHTQRKLFEALAKLRE
jgi:hypothetical protein